MAGHSAVVIARRRRFVLPDRGQPGKRIAAESPRREIGVAGPRSGRPIRGRNSCPAWIGPGTCVRPAEVLLVGDAGGRKRARRCSGAHPAGQRTRRTISVATPVTRRTSTAGAGSGIRNAMPAFSARSKSTIQRIPSSIAGCLVVDGHVGVQVRSDRQLAVDVVPGAPRQPIPWRTPSRPSGRAEAGPSECRAVMAGIPRFGKGRRAAISSTRS